MSALPPVGDLDGSTPGHNTGIQQAAFADLRAFLAGLLGTDGLPATARATLGLPMPNILDNPDAAIYQRAVAATADDVYMDDRWYALTQTNTITPSQLSNPEDGYRYGSRLTQSQAVAQRMGRAQIVKGREAIPLRNKTVTAGGRFKLSSNQTLRLALLAWTSTEDAVVSDVVSNWASGTFTPGNFFNAANLSLVASASQALVAATAASVSVSGVVPAGANNLIYLYWTEATAVQNVTLDAWGQRLIEAPSLVDAIRRPIADELLRCQQHYRILQHAFGDVAVSAAVRYQPVTWPEMHATPSVGSRTAIEADSNISSVAFSNSSVRGARLGITPTGANPVFLHSSWPLSADL